jgi:hypothetical protein
VTRTPFLSLLCGAALTLAIAGCGSSSSSSGLSKSQLAAKVNAACERYTKAALAVPQPSDFSQNPVHAASYLDKILALAQSTFGSLRGLSVQSGIKADYDAFLANEAHQLGLIGNAAAKAHARDRSGLRELQLAAAYKVSHIVPLDKRLGFTSCLK